MSIYLVLSNIKHNGTQLGTGTLFEGESGEFQGLVNDGALRVMDVATVPEAEAILAEESLRKEEAKEADALEPENLWEPKKEATPPAQATDEEPVNATPKALSLTPAGEAGVGDLPPSDEGDNL